MKPHGTLALTNYWNGPPISPGAAMDNLTCLAQVTYVVANAITMATCALTVGYQAG